MKSLPFFCQWKSQTPRRRPLLSRRFPSASRLWTQRRCPPSPPGWRWPSERPKPGVTVLKSSSNNPTNNHFINPPTYDISGPQLAGCEPEPLRSIFGTKKINKSNFIHRPCRKTVLHLPFML